MHSAKGDNMKFLITLSMILVLLPASVWAGIGPCDFSTAERAYTGAETLVMMVVPDGSGSSFSNARMMHGEADATVTLTLLDCNGVAVANFPAEDLWLECADGGLVFCVGGSIADANSDPNGITHWASPLLAGGSSQALTVVMINGAPLSSGPGLAIAYNSPDINGDRIVNLTDVPLFAADFYGSVYEFRSDFHYDGSVNLSDVVQMAQGLGSSCP